MKKIFMATTLMLLAVLNNTLIAQGLQRVPLSIYFPEQVETIPVEASNYLISKIGLATARNGMGATNEFTQFYITCISTVTDRYVVPGAPTKYFNKEELNFYVVDAFPKKFSIHIPFLFKASAIVMRRHTLMDLKDLFRCLTGL